MTWEIIDTDKSAEESAHDKLYTDLDQVKKEVEGDSTETDELAEEIKKLQETIAEDKKKVTNK